MKAHPWTALIGAVVLGAGALAMPAQAAGTAGAASAASEPAPGYGPGYGPGPGYGAGGGAGMRGGPARPGGWGPGAGYAQGYGPCGGGWGGGPGRMGGGWGGGWGGGPGMMGGWGGGPGMMGGWGGGPGMMGGWGGGPGMMGGWGGGGRWHHPAWAELQLSQAQVHKIEAIERSQSDKQWALMTKLHQLMWSAPHAQASGKPDVDAIMKIARQASDLRLQMMRNRLETRVQVDAVLTPQQRQELQQYRRRGW